MQKQVMGLVTAAFVSGMALGGALGYFAAGKGEQGDTSAVGKQLTTAELTERLGDEASELKGTLPKMADAETEWFDVTVGPGAVTTYWYRLVNYNGDGLNSEKFKANVESSLTKQVCAEPSMRENIGYGTTYRFNYVGKDRIKVAELEVDRQKCGF